jgi:hypothetical protein
VVPAGYRGHRRTDHGAESRVQVVHIGRIGQRVHERRFQQAERTYAGRAVHRELERDRRAGRVRHHVRGRGARSVQQCCRLLGVVGDGHAVRDEAAGVTRADHPDHAVAAQLGGQRRHPVGEAAGVHQQERLTVSPGVGVRDLGAVDQRLDEGAASVGPDNSFSVRVEPDLDPVRVVQPDQDRPALVACDDATVCLTEVVQTVTPGVDVLPLGHLEPERIEAGQG